MYVPMRDEPQPLQLKIPWDPHTAKGFVVAAVFLIVWMFAMNISDIRIDTVDRTFNTVPMDTMIRISFGNGDGTGGNHGNLTKEGKKNQGNLPNSNLNDAETAGKTTRNNNAPTNTDITSTENLTAVDRLSSDGKNIADRGGVDHRNIGSKDGSQNGRGLGNVGYGRGKGEGYGDIDWGGGGNRTVMKKFIPESPKGLNRATQIRIRFKVSSKGAVIETIPLTKGDPRLEKAAEDALKRWRFNPLKEDIIMDGTITFTFRLS